MDRETKDRIADYFDAADLIDFLQIPTAQIVEDYEEEITEALEEIEELMGVRRKDDDE